jgi:hypothetical protein
MYEIVMNYEDNAEKFIETESTLCRMSNLLNLLKIKQTFEGFTQNQRNPFPILFYQFKQNSSLDHSIEDFQ